MLAANNLDALVMPTDTPASTTDRVLGDHSIFADVVAGGAGRLPDRPKQEFGRGR